MQFQWLEQRMIHARQSLLAPYHATVAIDEASQAAFYQMLRDGLAKLYEEPSRMFPTLTEDDAHPNRFNCASYGKPELRNRMRAIDKKLDTLFATLVEVGKNGTPEANGMRVANAPSRKIVNQIQLLGLRAEGTLIVCDAHPQLAEAWRWLALASSERPFVLERCWFDDAYPYLQETYRPLYQGEAFRRLTDWLNANGYKQYAGFNRSECLDYAKCIKPTETKLGFALFGDPNHYGFTFEYRAEACVPQDCLPRLIQFPKLLTNLERLSEDSQRIIMSRTKRCDGCRYCVQTDKSGKRPLAAITVASGEKLCPYYPGFSFTRTELNEQDVDPIISLLTDLENMLHGA